MLDVSEKDSIPSLKELGRSIDEAKERSLGAKKEEESTGGQQYSVGIRIGIELVAGVIVGILIGYHLDELFGTKPLFFFIFLVIGVVAGFLNMYRAVMKEDNSETE